MKKMIFAAAAIAAGLTTFAAHAENRDTYLEIMKREQAIRNVDKTTTASIAADKAPGSTKAAVAAKSAKGGGYSAIISKYAAEHGVPVALAKAVVRIESNYRPNARGRAGEIGLMQIKPATARMMGYSGSAKGLYDPETNIRYGMKYLAKAHQLGGGDTCGTILRYNAGHGAKRMNKISAAYCAKVKRHLGGA
jgi:soluble lytic murein transglycosylase-like protein